MLKKVLHISAIVLLLFSTMGVTVYKHYCNGSLVSESVGFHAKKCCGENCKGCHNESTTFKITDNFETNNNSQTFKAELKKIFNYFSFAFELLHISIDLNVNHSLYTQIKICDTPPLIAENPTAMLQVFRL
jgi:hypothetical protein